MVAQAGRHVDRDIGVMDAVQPPQRRKCMREAMAAVVGQVEK